MKALQFKGYGALEQQLVFNEVNQPLIGATQILIEVHAASINPVDYKMINGDVKFLKLPMPSGVGFDVAGVIIEKGNNVTEFEIGDEVFGVLPATSPGSIAEYVAIGSDCIAHKPTNISMQEAAALPLAGLTVLQSFQKANLKSGDRVLIHAGSGGVGSLAIQYAKLKGAFVFTTTSTNNVGWVKALGADRVIDYTKENYLQIVNDVDIVLETLGDNYISDAFKVIKKGGTVMSLVGPAKDDETAKAFNLNWILRLALFFIRLKFTIKASSKSAFYKSTVMLPNQSQLTEIKDLIESEKLKPVIDKSFEFSKSIQALEYLKTGRAKGKVVINLK